MRLGRRPNQQDEAQVDLTSMLDIVFIMLIFFIVTIEHLLLDQPDASLVIQADEHAYNGTVVKVMDAAKGAGVKNIALAAEKP
ncbi:biopolymer transporter ExbD [Vibrio parahaemolyticus]